MCLFPTWWMLVTLDVKTTMWIPWISNQKKPGTPKWTFLVMDASHGCESNMWCFLDIQSI